MSTHATGTFEVKTWDEKPYDAAEGRPTLTRASVTQSMHGDIEGEGSVEYLMMYRNDNSASFIGLLRVAGRVGGRSGSFVLQCVGTYENGTVKSSLSVVPGSGAGDLGGLRGEGNFMARKEPRGTITLDYDFERHG